MGSIKDDKVEIHIKQVRTSNENQLKTKTEALWKLSIKDDKEEIFIKQVRTPDKNQLKTKTEAIWKLSNQGNPNWCTRESEVKGQRETGREKWSERTFKFKLFNQVSPNYETNTREAKMRHEVTTHWDKESETGKER